MPSYYPCRLRKFRKSAALSQRHLASLLGVASQSVISHYETQTRRPSLLAVMGCELLFGVPARDLFPALYAQVERDLRIRARKHAKLVAGAQLPAETIALLEAFNERLNTAYELSR